MTPEPEHPASPRQPGDVQAGCAVCGRELALRYTEDRLQRATDYIAATRPYLELYRDTIGAMRKSPFWRLRRLVVGMIGRLGRADKSNVDAVDLVDFDAITARFIGGAYDHWLRDNALRPSDIRRLQDHVGLLSYKPRISIVVPVVDPPEGAPCEGALREGALPDGALRAAIASVIEQAYPFWELCVASPTARSARVRAVVNEFATADRRIKLVEYRGDSNVAVARNAALAVASGDFASLLGPDGLLTPDALFEVVAALNCDPHIDMIYSDEDTLDANGLPREPFFKPDWSPETFLSRMYTGNLCVLRRTLIDGLGGFRPQFGGSEVYDLLLRLSERTDRIHHIPRILYHQRTSGGGQEQAAQGARGDMFDSANQRMSDGPKQRIFDGAKQRNSDGAERTSEGTREAARDSASRADDKAILAISEALERRGEAGVVTAVSGHPGNYCVRYGIVSPDRVSIVIPTRDHAADLERCLASIFRASTYANFEVVILDNGSTDDAALGVIAKWGRLERERVHVVRYDVPFNFSQINNYAVRHGTGRFLLFLNNDTEVVAPDWIEAMIEQAQRPAIGAVGARLLYEDGTIQHAGVVLRVGGVAGHGHRFCAATSPGYHGVVQTIGNFSAVTAACMMMRREVFDEIGGFDEALAVAFNDVDLCLRLGQRGYRIVYVPHAVLYHFESKSRGALDTPDKVERERRERAIMEQRWNCSERDDPYYSPHLSVMREDYSIRV